MNITRLNFPACRPLLADTLARAHFLAVDLEMSGITTGEATSPSPLDSYVLPKQTQKRYEKQRQSVGKFVPLQLGLCAFEVQPARSCITASPFNFYIFPLPHPAHPLRFAFHPATMRFLAHNHFDFNRLFYEGIPYSSQQELQAYRQQQDQAALQAELKALRQVESPEARAFVKLVMPQVEEWVNSGEKEMVLDITHVKYQSYTSLQHRIEEKHAGVALSFALEGEGSRKSRMVIRREEGSPKQSVPIEEEMLFTPVFNEIIASKKPLIVHNGFLDLMHMFLRFREPLPPTWTGYKRKVHSLFPHIYDNKYLFAHSPTLNAQTEQGQTGLQNCFSAMRELARREGEGGVRIELGEQFQEYSLESVECHEAGFDALMTGYSFLKGITHLNPDLRQLADLPAFHQEHALLRNRVPQGSIKVPFNFEEDDEDIYTRDGNAPLYFRSYLSQTADEQTILDYFSSYGSVQLLWTARDLTEFCIVFLSEEARERYWGSVAGAGETVAVRIGGVEWLVLSEQRQREGMRNLILREEWSE